MHPKRITSGKIPLAITLGIVSIVYTMWHYLGGEQPPAIAATITPSVEATSTVAVVATTTKDNIGTETPKSRGPYTDGIYIGTESDAFYGVVQVRATIQNGTIADVAFLKHPSDRETSIAVNNEAMPVLIQEAIKAQSAKVDTASGATFTSEAFRESLAAALAQATK